MVWFRGHRGVWSTVGLDLGGLFQPLWFYDFYVSRFYCVCGIAPIGSELLEASTSKKHTEAEKWGAAMKVWPGFLWCRRDPQNCYHPLWTLPASSPSHDEVVSPFHDLARKGTQVYPHARPLAFSPPLPLLELGWCTERDPGRSTELCPLHQPFVMSLGHHRDGRSKLHQHSSAEKLWTKWILPGSKAHFGWSVLGLPTHACTPPICASPAWVGLTMGPSQNTRAGALPWEKGCRQNPHRDAQHPTAALSAMAKQSRALRMTNVTV